MMEIIKILFDSAVVLWYLVFLIFLFVIYYRNAKPHKVTYNEQLRKNYPSVLNPVELSLLMYKKIVPEVFTASIIDLIRLKKIEVKKVNNDYQLTINNDIENEIPKSYEYILDILFNSIVKDPGMMLSKLEEYADNKANSTEFFTNYYVWKRIAHKETFCQQFYEPKMGYSMLTIYRTIVDILIIINFLTGFHNFLAYFLIVPSFILSFVFYYTYKRTKEANEEYYKWKAFRNYLINFSNENRKLNRDDICNFLVYGTVLRTASIMNNECFDGFDEFSNQLNAIIRKCVINANLHARREIKWK